MLSRRFGLIITKTSLRQSVRTMSNQPTVGEVELPSKSSLKKAEKLAAAAARKSLKEVISAANGVVAPVVGGGKKKEKPVVAVVEELPFIEVPEGQKKGRSRSVELRCIVYSGGRWERVEERPKKMRRQSLSRSQRSHYSTLRLHHPTPRHHARYLLIACSTKSRVCECNTDKQ